MSVCTRPMVAAKSAVIPPTQATTSSEQGRHLEELVAARHHVHARRHHGGGVDERGDRRGAFHGVGQPGVERELGGLAAGAHEEEERDGGIGPHAHRGVGLAEDGAVVQRAEGDPDQHDAQPEAEVPHPVHDEGLLARVGGGLLLVPEPDEEVRAEADRFPEDVEHEEVARQHQHHHREHEEVQIGEEAGVARIAVHVAGGVEMDEEPHPGHDQQHHRGELIHLRRERGLERPRRDPRKQLAHERLARPDAREDGAGGEEGGGQRGDGDPVRPTPDDRPKSALTALPTSGKSGISQTSRDMVVLSGTNPHHSIRRGVRVSNARAQRGNSGR